MSERERGMMGAVSPVCRNDARLKNTKALVFADDGILACFLSSFKSGSDETGVKLKGMEPFYIYILVIL